MTENRDESRGDFSAENADDRLISDRVQELTWAMLDEQISDDEFQLLETLLLSDDKARDSYVGCMQLHTELMAHFAGPTADAGAESRGGSQILGFLNTDPPLAFPSASAEEAAS